MIYIVRVYIEKTDVILLFSLSISYSQIAQKSKKHGLYFLLNLFFIDNNMYLPNSIFLQAGPVE